MFCARCGKEFENEDEFVWAVLQERRNIAPVCRDDRVCYKSESVKIVKVAVVVKTLPKVRRVSPKAERVRRHAERFIAV